MIHKYRGKPISEIECKQYGEWVHGSLIKRKDSFVDIYLISIEIGNVFDNPNLLGGKDE